MLKEQLFTASIGTMAKILLIEDDQLLVKMYREKFESGGFVVVVAESGNQGLTLASQEKPDFILLDILLPGTDGLTVLRNLKEDPQTRDIPVALLTALPKGPPMTNEDVSTAIGYWEKDHFTPAEIVEEVKKHLKS